MNIKFKLSWGPADEDPNKPKQKHLPFDRTDKIVMWIIALAFLIFIAAGIYTFIKSL